MHLAFQLQQPLANPIQQSERRPRPRARLRRRQLCGSPSGSPSPQHEEGGSSLAAGASSMEQSLKAQVRSEVERYAPTEGVLRRLVKERGKVFSDGGARAAIDSLCKHIVNAKSKSFTTHYPGILDARLLASCSILPLAILPSGAASAVATHSRSLAQHRR